MIYDHYGYQPLPQHAGPWFFTEQLAHLEIAVTELHKEKAKSIPRPRMDFEKTLPGRVLALLTEQNKFIAYREIGVKMGVSRKSASTAIQALKRLGYNFDEKKQNQVIMVRIK